MRGVLITSTITPLSFTASWRDVLAVPLVLASGALTALVLSAAAWTEWFVLTSDWCEAQRCSRPTVEGGIVEARAAMDAAGVPAYVDWWSYLPLAIAALVLAVVLAVAAVAIAWGGAARPARRPTVVAARTVFVGIATTALLFALRWDVHRWVTTVND